MSEIVDHLMAIQRELFVIHIMLATWFLIWFFRK